MASRAAASLLFCTTVARTSTSTSLLHTLCRQLAGAPRLRAIQIWARARRGRAGARIDRRPACAARSWLLGASRDAGAEPCGGQARLVLTPPGSFAILHIIPGLLARWSRGSAARRMSGVVCGQARSACPHTTADSGNRKRREQAFVSEIRHTLTP